MNDQLQALDQIRSTAIDLGMKFGPKLFVAIVILAAGYVAGRWAAGAANRMLARFHLDPPVRSLLERAVRIVVLGLFAIMALQNLGVELLPLIAGLGVAGAGAALAMQGVLSNVAAGLTIIFTRPFRVGDYVSISKEEGEVLDISLFTTVLGHADRSRVVIPNRKIAGEILHNHGTLRQLAVEVEVAYDTDLGAALRIIAEVLQGNGSILQEPAPVVGVVRLPNSGIAIGVNPWVKVPDFGAATRDIQRAIVEAFRQRKITIPVPQREIRMLAAAA
jgi:small conductance mechanosensitive channel